MVSMGREILHLGHIARVQYRGWLSLLPPFAFVVGEADLLCDRLTALRTLTCFDGRSARALLLFLSTRTPRVGKR